MLPLTLTQLTAMGIDAATAKTLLDPLNNALSAGRIHTPIRIAHFMAQCGHESIGFTRLVENLNYSVKALRTTFPKRITAAEAQQWGKIERGGVVAQRANPEAIANKAYGGRADLGNTQPGDGYRFRGRSYIQLTGRANYQSMGKVLGLDLEAHPDLAAQPAIALRIAVQFWNDRGLSAKADLDTPGPLDDEDICALITRRVNGGLNGFPDRLARLRQCKRALGI